MAYWHTQALVATRAAAGASSGAQDGASPRGARCPRCEALVFGQTGRNATAAACRSPQSPTLDAAAPPMPRRTPRRTPRRQPRRQPRDCPQCRPRVHPNAYRPPRCRLSPQRPLRLWCRHEAQPWLRPVRRRRRRQRRRRRRGRAGRPALMGMPSSPPQSPVSHVSYPTSIRPPPPPPGQQPSLPP